METNELKQQRQFSIFVAAAKAATANGKNVAPNRANFEVVREAIDDQAQDFNLTNVMEMLFRGNLDLRPNAEHIANQMVQEHEDSERDKLAEVVVDAARSWRIQTNSGSTVKDEYGRNQMLQKIKHLSLAELRSRVEVIEQNRALAGKSQEELKAQTAQDRQEQRQAFVASGGKPPLPEFTPQNERIDRAYLLKLVNVNKAAFADLVKRHSAAAVTARLNQQ